MTRLSVNINKIATLRNARGGNNPDVVKTAVAIEKFGAQGITIHPRPDQRHIRFSDVYALKEAVSIEYNIEGYPNPHFIQMVCEVKPTQVTLVPDPPGALTSNAGWDTAKYGDFLKEVIQELKQNGIRTSLFMETDAKQIALAAETGTDRIELYTEPYAHHFVQDKKIAIAPFVAAAQVAHQHGLGLNAGHDLSLENLYYFALQIPTLLEVSIGHALVCDALWYGLENTVQLYLQQLQKAQEDVG